MQETRNSAYHALSTTLYDDGIYDIVLHATLEYSLHLNPWLVVSLALLVFVLGENWHRSKVKRTNSSYVVLLHDALCGPILVSKFSLEYLICVCDVFAIRDFQHSWTATKCNTTEGLLSKSDLVTKSNGLAVWAGMIL